MVKILFENFNYFNFTAVVIGTEPYSFNSGISLRISLIKKVKNKLEHQKFSETLIVPFEFGDKKAWLHENGVVVNEFCNDNGFKFEVNWTAHQKAKYQSLANKYY